MTKERAMPWPALRERIRSRCDVAADGCWLWVGSLDNSGYGRMGFRGRNCRVSRVAWSAFNETEWPDGKHALHSCDNRRCVNPAHIRPGTNQENQRDCVARGRHPLANRTHCSRGHEFTPENTALYPYVPGRRCRQCDRDKAAVQNAKRKLRA